MMMDCPRCGFSQPKDRYCANCGLDVDSHLAKPKPLWLRLVQNSNLHLALIGLLMGAVVFYILYSRSSFVSRGVHNMLGTPIASRDASEREAPAANAVAPEPERETEAETAATEEEPAESAPAPTPSAATVVEPKKLEVAFFEVAHDTLTGLVTPADAAGEGTAGRAFVVKDASKIAEAVRTGGRKLGEPRTLGLTVGQQLTVMTPPTSPEPFQFGLLLQVTRWENREATVRWDTQLVLGQPETAAEMNSGQPALKAVMEANLAGSGTLGNQSLLILILEPMNRRPRPELVAKAGEGPWTVFNSEDFRAQLTDWVVIVQPK